MLIPGSCNVLIADISFQSVGETYVASGVRQIKRLVDAAAIVSVPVIVALYPPSVEIGTLATTAVLDADLPRLPFRPSPLDWSYSPLGRAIAATGRNQIIIAGLWLEEAVTLLALNCLAVGFDTYVAGDATAMIDTASETAAQARLTQAGAVPTSTEQVIREWAALQESAEQSAELAACLQRS
ncbi:MAG: isochorismatase family protein [Hyphomicrobiaceae bacterium]|nr:isochorismatase family protein [Hyphomicrobiaceae bacterium]